MIIAIDGPAASGKSTVAQKVAEELNYSYLNTGLLYRALAYVLVCQFGYTEDRLKNFKPDKELISEIFNSGDLEYEYKNNQAKVFYKKSDITTYLKNEAMDRCTSSISPYAEVREPLVKYQKELAKVNKNIVTDGRDCGSFVFPKAELKIFLTASVKVRAQRWKDFLINKGESIAGLDSEYEINLRDTRDKERKLAPLVQAKNAVLIDSSDLSIDEVVSEIISLAKNKK